MKNYVVRVINYILDIFSWRGAYKEIWRWAEIDGYDIGIESDCSKWLPKGHSPSDRVTIRTWNMLKEGLLEE